MYTSSNIKLLSVIMPAYGQERTIVKNIIDLNGSLQVLGIPFEIIVVVDGKTDKTYKRACKVKFPHVFVVGYEHNHGKGYAVRYGMARARGNVLIFIDAGGDIHTDSIAMLLEHFRWYNADIIVGSKRHPVSKVNYPWWRKIFSIGYQTIVRMFFGLHVRDTQVGLKLYRRGVLEDVLPRLLVKRFAFDIEILAVAYNLGYTRIYEAPIELNFTGVSSFTSFGLWRELFSMLLDTLAVFYRLRILRYYDTTNKRRWTFDPELNYRVNLP